jgi:hypothetical protein
VRVREGAPAKAVPVAADLPPAGRRRGAADVGVLLARGAGGGLDSGALPHFVRAAADVGVLMTHGAGAGLDSGSLPAFARSAAAAGLPCLRFECRGPLVHCSEVARAVLAAAPAAVPGFAKVQHWVLAGHSFGGRVMCEVAAALEPCAIAALLLLSYPLHPPGRPLELRDAPLTALPGRILFVQGTRDPFSAAAPRAAVLARMSADVAVHEVEGGDHALRVQGGAAPSAAALEAAFGAVQRFLEEAAAEAPEAGGAAEHRAKRRRRR